MPQSPPLHLLKMALLDIQLACHKDMMSKTNITADIQMVQSQKQAMIKINNAGQNRWRLASGHEMGCNVLTVVAHLDLKLALHQGPGKILSCNEEFCVLCQM